LKENDTYRTAAVANAATSVPAEIELEEMQEDYAVSFTSKVRRK